MGRGAWGGESHRLLLEGKGLAAGLGWRVDFRSGKVLSQVVGQETPVSGWGQGHGIGGNLETGGQNGGGSMVIPGRMGEGTAELQVPGRSLV